MGLVANPHAALAATKVTRPTRNIGRAGPDVAEPSCRDEHQPEGERVARDHPLQVAVLACRPFSIDGSATLTMLTSSSDMNPTTRQTEKARQRRGSGVHSPAPVATRSGAAFSGAPAGWEGARRCGEPDAELAVVTDPSWWGCGWGRESIAHDVARDVARDVHAVDPAGSDPSSSMAPVIMQFPLICSRPVM